MRAATVLVLVLVAPRASADDAVALRWSLKEGDTFYATTRVTQSHTIEAGERTVKTALTFDLTLRYRVTGVADGETTIEAAYLAADVRADGQDGLAGIGEKVRGRTVDVRLDRNHVPTAVRGHDAILKVFRDAPAVERDTAAALFGEGGVREIVGRPFDVLPAKPLRVGETVARPDRGTIGGLSSEGKTNSKLESVTDGVAKVVVKAELTIKAAGGAAPGAAVDLKSERAGGEYTFDTRTGRLKTFGHETAITGTITPAGGAAVKVVIRQHQTVTVHDKNPVRD